MKSIRLIDNVEDWVGGIPKGWNRAPLKRIAWKLNRPTRPDDPIVVCTNKGKAEYRGEKSPGLVSLTGNGYQGVLSEDLLIHGMDTWHGAIAVSDISGQCTSVVHVCDSNENKRFLSYYLRALSFRGVYKAFSNGVRQNTSDFRSWMKAGEIPVVLPSLEAQRRIANYLDEKCAQIDRAIEAAEGSIEEYKAYKESIVSHAVTKGFKSDAKMMESGIEWLGSVPVTWRVRYPKYLFALRKERARANDVMLTASQHHGMIPQERFMAKEAYSPVPVEKGHDILKHVEPGDFVISMRSFQGGLEYSQVRGKMSSAYLALYPISDDIDSSYYRWLFKSPRYIEGLQSTTNLVRDGQALRYANFLQLWLPVPPIDEQQYIADYLDEKCSQIDRAVSAKKAIIEDLKTYKHSLIYEVVTGKREV
ncbi:restriction endonuclease subunit S [Collinsella intestinalis]|uniref:restriction endonuclease subunit S n=1 Tax=Collinsella intestinalis TaxID=147207 RepID=UPI0019584811|nr:restriction endonuclease subunit S [Collinsella intestinalis]MBM6907481.1 restriction endonuclease subunit S [Collinsella intestinalis]